MALIKLNNVWKTYNIDSVEVDAIKDSSAEINKGDFIAVIGPSGSGKSTMMHLIGCLDIPTKGSILLENINICSLNESSLAQIRGKKIGFIFQQFNLIQNLTALENVMLPMMFQNKTSREERMEKAEKLLEKVGLGERAGHKPGQMSGGEQQRVAIARALANDPEIILADEPTGNIDSKRSKEIIEILRELNKEGKTVIIVTHDKEIAKIAKKHIKLKDGKIEK